MKISFVMKIMFLRVFEKVIMVTEFSEVIKVSDSREGVVN